MHDTTTADTFHDDTVARGSDASTVKTTTRAAGFWMAVVAPFANLAVMAGIVPGVSDSAVLGIILINVAALILGRNHNR